VDLAAFFASSGPAAAAAGVGYIRWCARLAAESAPASPAPTPESAGEPAECGGGLHSTSSAACGGSFSSRRSHYAITPLHLCARQKTRRFYGAFTYFFSNPAKANVKPRKQII
jgi:hypothetical protein